MKQIMSLSIVVLLAGYGCAHQNGSAGGSESVDDLLTVLRLDLPNNDRLREVVCEQWQPRLEDTLTSAAAEVLEQQCSEAPAAQIEMGCADDRQGTRRVLFVCETEPSETGPFTLLCPEDPISIASVICESFGGTPFVNVTPSQF